MHDKQRERPAADAEIQLQAIALENAVAGHVGECQGIVEQVEIGVSDTGMRFDIDAFDLLAVAGLLAHENRNIDPPAVIALDQIFLAVAIADHAEEIAVFEGLQRRHIVGFLQAEDIGVAIGNGERRHLPRVIGIGDGAGFLQPLVFRLVLDVEEPENAILLEVVAKAGKIEPAHQVLDIEGGKAKGHQQFPDAIAATLANQPQKAKAFLRLPFRPDDGLHRYHFWGDPQGANN